MNCTKSLVKLAPQMRLVTSTRNMSAISGPPSYRLSGAEKLAHGVALCVGWFAIPTWVLFNIHNYKNKGGAE